MQLKASKARIGHTLHVIDARVGFDFLGFSIRHYATGKTRPKRDGRLPRSYKLLIKPSTEAVKYAATLGWSPSQSEELEMGVQQVLATRRLRSLQFSTPAGLRLIHHADTPILRHVKVRGTVSPFNGDLVYWSQRLRQHPLTVGRLGILLQRQHGRCAWCGSLFLDRSEVEVDPVQPQVLNGHTDLSNLQLLHRHCHDQKSVFDGSATRRHQGVHAKNREAEEPNAGKLARSALQTSRSREGA